MSIVLLPKINTVLPIFNAVDFFREYIQRRQAALGLSQNALAEKSGKSGAWLSRLMTGDRKDLKVETLVALAKALNIHPYRLILAYQGIDPDESDKLQSINDDVESFEAFKQFRQWQKSQELS